MTDDNDIELWIHMNYSEDDAEHLLNPCCPEWGDGAAKAIIRDTYAKADPTTLDLKMVMDFALSAGMKWTMMWKLFHEVLNEETTRMATTEAKTWLKKSQRKLKQN